MTKRRQIHRDKHVKTAALTLIKNGKRAVEVSRLLTIPTPTLCDWVKAAKAAGTWGPAGDNNNGNGLAEPAPRKLDPGSGGQNKILTAALEKKIRTKLKRLPFMTPSGLKRVIPELADVSERTIRHWILKNLKIPSRIAAWKPFLTDAQKERRLAWAEKRRNWSVAKWRQILWSDETHIELWNQFRGYRVRRPSTIARFDASVLRRSVKHPPKLMIWGSFGNGKLGRVYFCKPNSRMNAEMYLDVLTKHLKASLTKTGTKEFMQDGAPCHRALRVQLWFDTHRFRVLPWVGQSCDLNPIEHLWTKLKRLVSEEGAASNLRELCERIKAAWRLLGRDTEYLARLCDSMPSRVQAVIQAQGDVTKY